MTNMAPSSTRSIKVVVLGDEQSGKSTLIARLCSLPLPVQPTHDAWDVPHTHLELQRIEVSPHPPSHPPPSTASAHSSNNCAFKIPKVEIRFHDTITDEGHDRLRPLTYPQTDVFLLCFDASNLASLGNIAKQWVPEVEHYAPGTATLVIGLKADLLHEDWQEKRSEEWKMEEGSDGVSDDDEEEGNDEGNGDESARSGHLLVSAHTGQNIDALSGMILEAAKNTPPRVCTLHRPGTFPRWIFAPLVFIDSGLNWAKRLFRG